MTTYHDLIAQKAALEKQQADLDKQIATARKEERGSVIAQIKALMSEHDITLAELGGSRIKNPADTGRKPSSLAGKKVAPKYRNKATGETWSGRGLQPKWLNQALAEGHPLESFAV